ncbi:hypothetical protein QR680_001819 [Steinernema hermaphroditum]|uniref:FAM20 C-terminal domain-containing protein n=1 Tax=Steinernema hermaphroditum TaxID=289476 RepID=A0AA39H006_9BILA|nr:hypothetical protein QR680_001819 [Steinernema hermaphroditum]
MKMQTLRFNTRRIFLLISIAFSSTLLFLVCFPRDSSKDKYEEGWLPSLERSPKFRGANARHQQMKRPDEQLGFQPQPPPNVGKKLPLYSELNIKRVVDNELVDRLLQYTKSANLNGVVPQECRKNETLAQFWKRTKGQEVPVRDSWERFYASIGSCDLYHEESVIDDLLKDLNTLPIKHTAIMEGGTQVKLILTFENDKQAVFKPMRFGRDYESDPNHFYFSDFERHHAEIATFHLDKILGYRRAVPTVGRVVNLTSDIRDHSDRKLRKTFFVSPAKNHCFVSKCDYYCDTTHAICGSPDLKEGSVQVFLPDDANVPRKHNKSPYRRTYSKKTQQAIWQQDMKFCTWKVKTRKQYAHGRRLLDLVDLHIMDYLIGNQDRHHYESFSVFGPEPSYAIHLDNGRSFGRSDFDDEDILLPLRQCCVIRPSTFQTLLNFYRGQRSLTEVFHESLSKDPASPILAYKHYNAMERRLQRIMEVILECLDKKRDVSAVIMAEYHNPQVAEPAPVFRKHYIQFRV